MCTNWPWLANGREEKKKKKRKIFKTLLCSTYNMLRRTGALLVKDTMDYKEVVSLTTDSVHQVPNTFLSPPLCPSQDQLHNQPGASSFIGMEKSSASINSTISDITLRSMQK